MFACSISAVYRIKITEVSKDTVIISLTQGEQTHLNFMVIQK